VFRECVFEIPETAGVSRFREIAALIPETTDYPGLVQKLSELLIHHYLKLRKKYAIKYVYVLRN
jgi:hypothetical protein